MLNKLPGFGKPQHKTLENGIIDTGDAGFAALAAVHESGTCYVADGYRYEDEFTAALMKYQESGVLPDITSFKITPLDEVRAYYGAALILPGDGALGETTQTQGQRRLLDLISAAARARASDLKIYKHDTMTFIRLKVAGREFDYGQPWTPEEGENAISFAFNALDKGTGENTEKDAAFQSFSISPKPAFPLPPNVVKLRAQKGYHESDTRLGSFLVCRLFYNEDKDTDRLEDLGFDAEITDALAEARANLHGCVIIGGETGDGKSTTLIRALEALYDRHGGNVSLATLEDPVEYRLRRSGVLQIPLQSVGDNAVRQTRYEAALRNFVRINPDVGMVSEIRDGAGGREALKFATSGHAIYTTVHVDSANGIPFRLMALGVPAEELAQSGVVRLLIKQTLAPILCPDCKTPLAGASLNNLDQRLFAPIMADRDSIYLRNADGCETCLGDTLNETGKLAWAGYQRQIAVGEIIAPDKTWFDQVLQKNFNGALAHWLTPKSQGGLGGIPIARKLTELVLQGDLDPYDALRKHGDLAERMSEEQRAGLAGLADLAGPGSAGTRQEELLKETAATEEQGDVP